MVMSTCFILRKGQDPAHQLAETMFSSDFPKCISQFSSAGLLLYSFTTPACLFQVVGEVYGVMTCFPFVLLFYMLNCC